MGIAQAAELTMVELVQPRSLGAKDSPEPKRPDGEISDRDKTINKITRDMLSYAKVSPITGTTYERNLWRFVRSFVNSRLRPEHIGKTVTADDHLAERMSRILRPNTRSFTTENETKNGLRVISVDQKEDHVLRKYKTEDGQYVVEIIYGCGETTEDEKFLNKLYSDPKQFLLDSELPVSSQIKITFKRPKDIPFNPKIERIANEATTQLGIEWEEKEIPLSYEQLVAIDREIDKGQYKRLAGNLETQKQLEIRLPTVENAISEIIQVLPEKSALRKLLLSDRGDIAAQVYEYIKFYKSGNIAWEDNEGEDHFNAVGALFEACVSYELKNSGLGEMVEEIVGIEGVVSSTDSDVYNRYRQFAYQRYIPHCDGFVSVNSEDAEEIIGIIECKTSPNERLSKDVFSQVSEGVRRVTEIIAKTSNSQTRTRSTREMLVFIIKPNSMVDGKKVFKIISPVFVIGESKAHILRSNVTIEDLNIARGVFDKLAGIESKKQASESSEA